MTLFGFLHHRGLLADIAVEMHLHEVDGPCVEIVQV